MGTGKQWLLSVSIALGSGDMVCFYSSWVTRDGFNLVLARQVPKSTATTSFLIPCKTFTFKRSFANVTQSQENPTWKFHFCIYLLSSSSSYMTQNYIVCANVPYAKWLLCYRCLEVKLLLHFYMIWNGFLGSQLNWGQNFMRNLFHAANVR